MLWLIYEQQKYLATNKIANGTILWLMELLMPVSCNLFDQQAITYYIQTTLHVKRDVIHFHCLLHYIAAMKDWDVVIVNGTSWIH
jgi:hypothetical protein